MATARRRASALALILILAAVGACGGDDETGDGAQTGSANSTASEESTPAADAGGGYGMDGESSAGEPSGGGGGRINVTAVENEDGLGFDPSELTARAGSVTIVMDNPERNELPHTVAIEGAEASGEPVPGGESSTVTARLEPGEYTFYCPVGQHRQNGMEGTLTVR